MVPQVETKLNELRPLCVQYRVRRLEIFGSGATGKDEPGDLDFLVDFESLSPAEYVEAYFGLLEALEAIFQKPVDLVALSAVKNPYFIEGIKSSRTLLYAA